MRIAQPHTCRDCGTYYGPRAEHERERCYACAGVSNEEHWRATSGESDEREPSQLVTLRLPVTEHVVELGAEGNGRPSTDDLLDALDGLF